MYYAVTRTNELQHHGIKGQKWGKRNGPPYPLGESDHSASEKKAGWKKSLKKTNKVTKSDITDQRRLEEDELLRKYGSKKYNDEKRETAKKIIIASAVVIGVGAAVYLAYQHGAISRIDDLAKAGVKDEEVFKKAVVEALQDAKGADAILVRKQGEVLHRMTAEAGIDFSKVKMPTFAAYEQKDIDKYMLYLKDFKGTGERYDVTLKAMEDIVAPTREKARLIFEDLIKNDPQASKDLENCIFETYKRLYQKAGRNVSDRELRALVISEIKKDSFSQGVYAFGLKNQTFASKYSEALKQKGFNAIFDYHDIDGGFTKKPVIILDPSKTLTKKGEVFVTNELKAEAAKRLGALFW